MADEEVTEQQDVAVQERYDLPIRISDVSRPKLIKSAHLAHQMRLIPNPSLTEPMNLYVKWGQELLRKTWLDKMGYK